uniref:Uncharacterized protein n=1 Tax=Oryza sativa subsp. japonica TaxID=39947 RepID=Q5Z4Z4_ORYSJ|nr:hypothetical protein [Oryza sativa Japonica Group]
MTSLTCSSSHILISRARLPLVPPWGSVSAEAAVRHSRCRHRRCRATSRLVEPPDRPRQIVSSLLSHHDRLSFVAVCSQWHLGTLWQHLLLPLPLPWLLNLMHPRTYQNLAAGVVHQIPRRARTCSGVSSYDNGWLMGSNMTGTYYD